MYFSSNQMDQLATMLENKSGDTRYPGEDSESRIISSLEKLGNTSPSVGIGYAERVLNAVNAIDFSGGGESQYAYVDGNVQPWPTVSGALCMNFNGTVEIDPNLTDWQGMFEGLYSFNQPVTVPQGVISLDTAFSMSGFNQPITIPNSVVSVYGMFGTNTFNAPVTLNDGLTSLYGLFRWATAFNQPINIPNSVTNCAYMFEGATEFKQDIVFPENVNDVSYAFNFSDYYGNVYVLNNDPNISRIFINCDSDYEKTLYLANQSIDISDVARSPISNWETVDNGYFNSGYNIRVLYNMPDAYLPDEPADL